MGGRMDHGHAPPRFPRGVLLGAAALLGLTLVLSAVGRWTGMGTTMTPAATAVDTRVLRFADRPDGGVDVIDTGTGASIFVARPGTNGFLRGVLRGMSRVRKLEDVAPGTPYRLTHWSDGRLSLADPGTGREVNLEVFGPDNYGVFARLVTTGAAD